MNCEVRVRTLVALVGCSLACAASAAQPTIVPDALTARAKILKALGGEQRLANFTALHAVGSMEGVSGFPGRYELWAQAPANRAVTWDIGYLRQTTAVDAQGAWERVTETRELAGAELARTRRDGRFAPLYKLLKEGAALTVSEGQCGPTSVYTLAAAAPGDLRESWGIDRKSFLPVCAVRTEVYEEGPQEVRLDYADYRSVRGLMLPFSVNETRPDVSLKVRIERYEVNPTISSDVFANPQRAHWNEPVVMRLATLPSQVYREDDGNFSIGSQRFWGMYFYQSASWSFDLMVKEQYGRFIEPLHARAELYAGDTLVGSQEWDRPMLEAMRRAPVTRFSPQGEIYGFRHNFSTPQGVAVDRIAYTLEARDAHGDTQHRTLSIPIRTYRPHARLIFPMKGKFLVTSGHEYYELEHKYERSQQFAIDVVALGDDFEFARHDGASMEDYVGYGRRAILAPAAGTVVFARNDIPDGTVKADFLKKEYALEAIAGNLVVIDHGNGEFSVFCHMRHGSVAVRRGDRIEQGQTIGYLGAAGSPGLPHLHYQLQNGPNIFGNDGLPLVFENIERIGWLGRGASDDTPGAAAVEQPRSGVYMIAR